MTSNDLHCELFQRFRDHGDTAALGELFDAVSTDLFRVALYVATNPSDAEDLVQATFLTAIESASGFDASRPLQPWLTGILTNHARRRRRDGRKADRAPLLDGLDAPVDADVVGAAARDEARERIAEALRGLPQPYRQVVTLHLEEGMTARRIGEVLERPAGTVRSQVVRGLELLRKAMPASLAGGLAVSLSAGHALAGVRVEVLHRAAQLVPAAASAASVAAGATRSSLWGGAVALALVAAVAVLWPWGAPPPVAPPASNAAPTERGGAAARPIAAGDRSEASGARRAAQDGAASAPGAASALFVRILDEAGRPQPGLTCRCVATAAGFELFSVDCARDGSASAVSDERGELSFDLQPGDHQLWIVGTNLRKRCRAPSADSRGALEWRVPAATMVSGQVVDDRGAPLAGVDVFASATAGSADVPVAVAQTAEDGAFTFSLAARKTFVWAAGAGRRSVAASTTGAPVRLVAAAATGRCEVEVRDADGELAVGAAVAVFAGGSAGTVRPPRFALTDERGVAALEGLVPGPHVFSARSGEANSLRVRRDVSGQVEAKVRLRLHPGGELRGRVAGAASTAPGSFLVYAQVPALEVGSFDGRLHSRLAATDADGRYAISGMPSGEVRVRLVRAGAANETAIRSLTFAPGELRTLDFTVGERILQGRVHGLRDPARYAVTVAPVGPAGRVLPVYRLEQPVDEDGAFAVVVPPRIGDLAVFVARAGCRSPRSQFVARALVAADAESVALDVAPDALAAAAVSVTLDDERDRGASARLLQPERQIDGVAAGDERSFDSVRPGRYTLRVQRVDGYVWCRQVTVPGSGTRELGALRAATDGALTVDALGAVRVELLDERGCLLRAVPVAATVAMPEGRYQLRVSGADAVPRTEDLVVTAGRQTQVAVAAGAGARCALVFRFDPASNPLDLNARLLVCVYDPAGRVVARGRVEAPSDASYTWTQRLAPGAYEVRATAAWGGVVRRQLVVAPQQAEVRWDAELQLR